MSRSSKSILQQRSVLFVCSANQCRSPMAMALFADLIKRRGLRIEDWRIESAGCWAYPGLPATSNARAAMEALGLSLEEHRSQPVTEALLDQFQLILCMELDHKRSLQRNSPDNAERIYMLSELVDGEQEVADPVGLSVGIYKSTVQEISGYLEDGFKRILQLTE